MEEFKPPTIYLSTVRLLLYSSGVVVGWYSISVGGGSRSTGGGAEYVHVCVYIAEGSQPSGTAIHTTNLYLLDRFSESHAPRLVRL